MLVELRFMYPVGDSTAHLWLSQSAYQSKSERRASVQLAIETQQAPCHTVHTYAIGAVAWLQATSGRKPP
jgi:hypothetical protein